MKLFSKKTLYNVLKIIIIVFSYFFIFQYLKNFDFKNFFKIISAEKINLLILAFVLMPINWLIEAIKWKILIEKLQPISLKNALKGVFIGISAGIITPNRIGEIFGRQIILKKENRKKGIFATSVGSLSQFFITFTFGLFSLMILSSLLNLNFKSFIFLSLLILVAFGLIFLIFKDKILIFLKQRFSFFIHFQKKTIFLVLWLSLFRYFVFIIQYFLLLQFLTVNVNFFTSFVVISSIYLIINILPNSVLSDLGIRGSASLFLFKFFTDNILGITLAPILLWMINIVIPAIIGQIFILKTFEQAKI